MDSIKPWQSKTLIVNVLLAVSAIFVPSVHDWLIGHPDVIVYIFAGLNVILRLVTKQPVDIFS